MGCPRASLNLESRPFTLTTDLDTDLDLILFSYYSQMRFVLEWNLCSRAHVLSNVSIFVGHIQYQLGCSCIYLGENIDLSSGGHRLDSAQGFIHSTLLKTKNIFLK